MREPDRKYASDRSYDRHRTSGQNHSRKRRRKKSKAPLIIIILLVILVALGVVVAINWNNWFGAKDDSVTQPTGTQSSDASATTGTQGLTYDESLTALLEDDSSLPVITKDDQVNVTDLSITEGLDDNWLNVLLLGGDARDLSTPSRTDTMIICSINKTTGQIKLTTIMRDVAVKFTNIGENNGTRRINTAYYFGGPTLAMQTVNSLFGMNIQYYAFVNFFGFQQIAHAMGGVDMDITESEMEQINKWVANQWYLGEKYGVDESNLESENVQLFEYGENVHLNGRQTLAYCRIRKIDSDFARSERQRKVLTKLLDKLRGYSAFELSSLAYLSAQYFTTNMDFNDILSIAMIVLQSDELTVETLRLPVNGTYTQETRNDESMLYDCDWEANKTKLYSFIYGG